MRLISKTNSVTTHFFFAFLAKVDLYLIVWQVLKKSVHGNILVANVLNCMTGGAPDYLSEQFIRRSDVSTQKINIPFFKTATGQRTFYYRTVSLWNSLPPELKTAEFAIKFKRLLRRSLFNEPLAIYPAFVLRALFN